MRSLPIRHVRPWRRTPAPDFRPGGIESLARAPEGSSVALLTLLAVAPEESVEIRWDEVRFADDPAVLFGDGFESGKPSVWSSSLPRDIERPRPEPLLQTEPR